MPGRPPRKPVAATLPEHSQYVATNFKRARLRLRETQQQLSARTGMGQKEISAVERGQANPTLKSLEALAEMVGLTVGELIRPPSTRRVALRLVKSSLRRK